MANEFTCWVCKDDGTRCDCHKSRPPTIMAHIEPVQERIDRNNREIAANLRQMSHILLTSKKPE